MFQMNLFYENLKFYYVIYYCFYTVNVNTHNKALTKINIYE
jgi:hypothetical protein